MLEAAPNTCIQNECENSVFGAYFRNMVIILSTPGIRLHIAYQIKANYVLWLKSDCLSNGGVKNINS